MRNVVTIAVSGLCLLLCSNSFAEHYQLFLLTGQSNSLGVTNGGETDWSIGDDPADADVPFFWKNVANATTTLGDSGGEFVSLRETQGGFYAGSETHWGPEISFARTLYRAGMRHFGIIKVSRGGGGNGLWSKADRGHMYQLVVDTVGRAADALTNDGHTFEIIGLMYLQGESDSRAEAAIADTQFSQLLDNLRADLPSAESMQGFIGGVAAAGGNRDLVRAKQAALAARDARVHYFDNLDQQPRLHDSLHFNKAAKITVGERYAGAIMRAGLYLPSYGKLVFVGDSITQGGAGQASYRYAVFKHLVDRGASYAFGGSVSGAYQSQDLSTSTQDYRGKTFANSHEGHWGWRAFWINGRSALPPERRGANRGEGTILNWTGQTSPQRYALGSAGNFVIYPDPSALGTGNTGGTYTPDTVVIMIGINDLADGASAEQVRDDIGLMIDQLRTSNPNIRIHVCTVLHTDQSTPGLQSRIKALNVLLAGLSAAKNAISATSPVWVADTSSGFDPVTMTHDTVHPNTVGEQFVGERVAASLGLLETPAVAVAAVSRAPVLERAVAGFSHSFEGDEIFNGSRFVNGWTEVTAAATSEVLEGDLTDLRRLHRGGAAAWLEGTASGWNKGNDGDWTLEMRIKVNAAPNGFVFWLGVDGDLILIEVYDGRTRGATGGGFDVAHTNNDGEFHTFRVAHVKEDRRYHVWRDGERLTVLEGIGYDFTNNDSRLIIGDSTGGSLGDGYDILIDSVYYDQSGAYLPPGADADEDGMSDAWEFRYFQNLISAEASSDEDRDSRSNLDEFWAGTSPVDPTSAFGIGAIRETLDGWLAITVPKSSAQRSYTLFESADLGSEDPWRQVGVPITGNDDTLKFLHTGTKEKGFFRVEVSSHE
jgi:hypothetical protein